MAVVVLISLLTGLAAPSMMNALADARARDLTGRIVNLYNGARARAGGSGRAQLVRFTAAANGAQGGLVAYEGNNSSCNASNWGAIVAVGCVAGGFCTEQLNPADGQLSDEVFQLGMRTTGNAGTFAESAADICYEPTGTTFWRAGAAVGANLLMNSNSGSAGGSLGGGFLIRVQRLDSGGVALSPDRMLIVPLGAAARVAR